MKYHHTVLLLVLLAGFVSMHKSAKTTRKPRIPPIFGGKFMEKHLKCIATVDLASCFLDKSDVTKLQNNTFTIDDTSKWIQKTTSALSCPYQMLKKSCKLNFAKLAKLVKLACRNKVNVTIAGPASAGTEFKISDFCKMNASVVKALNCVMKRDWKTPETCINKTAEETYGVLTTAENLNKTGEEKIKLLTKQVACSDCLNGFDRIVENCNKKIACHFKEYITTKIAKTCAATDTCKKFTL